MSRPCWCQQTNKLVYISTEQVARNLKPMVLQIVHHLVRKKIDIVIRRRELGASSKFNVKPVGRQEDPKGNMQPSRDELSYSKHGARAETALCIPGFIPVRGCQLPSPLQPAVANPSRQEDGCY